MRGLVVGKFCPPHKGHNFLIDTAAAEVDELLVLVTDTPVPGFNIPAEQRALWLAEIHRQPNVTVRTCQDIMTDDSDLWAEYTVGMLGYTPDVVFTSEDYGDTWAKALGCRHRKVDYARTTVPISGTKVRTDPLGSLEKLHPVVRAHFVRRVVVVGAESTGTTTLASALGKHYDTVVVPEFGRLRDEQAVAEGRPKPLWLPEEFFMTALTQQAMEDRLAKQANRLLVCDTDALATALWHKRYLGIVPQELIKLARSRTYDLYIVTDYQDVPAEQDGFRFEMHKRPAMQQEFINWLRLMRRDYIIATGTPEQRLNQSIEAISKLGV